MSTTPRASRGRIASERGAILIQVGVAILVLSAFSMFIIDYGVMWVSRHQAQNAADAGALAGAVALSFDDFDDRSDTGPAKVAAQRFAQANWVWGESPDVQMDTDVRFYPDAPDEFPASCATDDCIRVDVFRNQVRDNALPIFFGRLVGVTDQGVRASAIAQVAAANASDCLKPWALADKWAENNPTPNSQWTPTSTFDPTGEHPDVYTPQNGVDNAGTSFTLNDVGTELTLKVGHPGDTQITPGWFQALDLPCETGGNGGGGGGGGTGGDDTGGGGRGGGGGGSGGSGGGGGGGANCYEENIRGCTTTTYAVGNPDLPKENGDMAGPTRFGTQDLIDLDPEAEWDSEAKKVVNSCVEPPYSCSQPGFKQSPRIVAIPVFDTQQYWQTGGPGQGTVHITQILGFFVDRLEPSNNGNGQMDVVGVLASEAGLKVTSGGNVAPQAAFLKVIQLVR